MKKRFQNKSIIVTGAGGGIGLATAQAFAKEGGSVLMTDLNEAPLTNEAEKIRLAGGIAESFVMDVTDYEQCEAMVAYAVEKFGGLHVAFNNAGIPSDLSKSFATGSLKEWSRTIETNLNGVYYCMRAEASAMQKSGGGAIINTGSVASKVASRHMAAYVAAKHGVVGLTKAAALDLIDDGIRVNAVCPGAIHTPMTKPLLDIPEIISHFESVPIKRMGLASEIASAVLFLASEESSFIVGETLNVDGGLLIE